MAFVAASSCTRLLSRSTLCHAAIKTSRSAFVGRRSATRARVCAATRRALASMTAAEGASAPEFSATDTDGNSVSLEGLRGSKVVLFFMAGAGMGCTTQSCAFRDAAAELAELDAKIIAVSSRSDGAAFKANNSLTYPVINDTDGALQRLYGVPKTFGIIPGRFTFIIDKEGVVRKVFNSQFSISQHVTVAKEAVKAM